MQNEQFNRFAIDLRIINLEHRLDRRQECIRELKNAGLSISEASFFTAKNTPSFGAYGCALSHAMVLADFLYRGNSDYILVFEDDFQIRDGSSFIDNLNRIMSIKDDWDVFLLGHNEAVPIEHTKVAEFQRCINSQTASGYLVGYEYAPVLLASFFKAATLLKKYKNLPLPNLHLARHAFSLDIFWKSLQVEDRFFISIPSVVIQRESYSDIQMRHVNYGV